ncbi:helix-turn-helix domain-containing protein [Konateibacter massiliensis]|uniref:helix-turn-helix domain-containing protein n=1 Tax=Konateibacter massiliensis TaxID=2002841 RepID=UPI0015D50F12|nr:helix-turn-helix domain-containing protein [Konateibacter massiliensis]
MKDIIGIILNPVRVRIIQEVAAKQNITANELCDKMPDIPRTTLYRHINILLGSNIFSVVSERKVRGSLERTIGLKTEEMSKINSLELASQNALSFLCTNLRVFKAILTVKIQIRLRIRFF